VKPSGRGLLGTSSSVWEPVGLGADSEMTEVMAAEGTESAILVTSGAEEETVAEAVAEAEAWATGTEVVGGAVELDAELPEGEAEPLPLPVELPPVEGPEEPEAPSQRAGPGISYESMGA